MELSLEDFGLTSTESKVYVALLKRGTSQAGRLSKETKIHRRTIYDAIERLINKGLISYITINNIRHFEAISADRLMALLKEKEEKLKKFLPELKAISESNKEKKETLFFKGKEGLKAIFDDQIRVGKNILFMGKGVDVNTILKFYFQKFDKMRLEKNIKINMVFDYEAKNIESIHKIPLSEIRYVEKWNSSPLSAYIYGNNVSLVLWDNNPIAILIRQHEFADGFRNYFNILWESATV